MLDNLLIGIIILIDLTKEVEKLKNYMAKAGEIYTTERCNVCGGIKLGRTSNSTDTYCYCNIKDNNKTK